jgi:hypothetical protein
MQKDFCNTIHSSAVVTAGRRHLRSVPGADIPVQMTVW